MFKICAVVLTTALNDLQCLRTPVHIGDLHPAGSILGRLLVCQEVVLEAGRENRRALGLDSNEPFEHAGALARRWRTGAKRPAAGKASHRDGRAQGALLTIVRAFLGQDRVPERFVVRSSNPVAEYALTVDGRDVDVRAHERYAAFEIPKDLLLTSRHVRARRTQGPVGVAAPLSAEETLHECVISYLAAGPLTIRSAADLFGCSTRVLQRALAAENTCFSAVVARARLEVALQELGDPAIPIIEVALKLGYSEHSAFTRAFRGWTGVAPAHYQKRQLVLQN